MPGRDHLVVERRHERAAEARSHAADILRPTCSSCSDSSAAADAEVRPRRDGTLDSSNDSTLRSQADELVRASRASPPAEAMAALSELELAGLVASSDGIYRSTGR